MVFRGIKYSINPTIELIQNTISGAEIMITQRIPDSEENLETLKKNPTDVEVRGILCNSE